jgi:hypothetical protein
MPNFNSCLNAVKPKTGIDCLMIVSLLCYWFWALTSSMALVILDSLPDRSALLIPSVAAEVFLWIIGIALVFADILLRARHDPDNNFSALTEMRHRLCYLVPAVLLARILFSHLPCLSANILYYVPLAVLAWALCAVLSASSQTQISRRRVFWEWTVVLVFSSLIYWSLGLYFTNSVGEHSGDEGHYLIQAESLFRDGDLDIRNNFEEPEKINRSAVHISGYSRNDKWYSWHTPGLSILLAPTVGAGLIVRHLVLGLIAGLGLAGVYLLGIQVGASRRSLFTILVLLGCSAFYGIYASRALPEVLGATLATYGMLATLVQKRFPWLSAVICALLVSYLPWAQTRFIPLALTVAGCYGIQGLLGREPWGAKLRRLSIFSLLCLVGLAGFQLFQFWLFEGGTAYPVRDLLFSFPVGLWHTLASSRGILYAFPVFASVLAAVIYLLCKAPRKTYPVFALLYFLSVFLTSCSTPWFTGGACLPGRFLLVVTPVMIVALALVLSDSGPGFRFLACYLGLFSVSMFVVELGVLEYMGKSFANPYVVSEVHPMLQGLVPLLNLYNPYETTRLMSGILLYGLAIVLVFAPHWPIRLQAGVLLAVAVFLVLMADLPDGGSQKGYTPRQVEHFLSLTDKGSAHLIGLKKSREVRDIFEFSNRFGSEYHSLIRRVTTEDLGTISRDGTVSIPHLPPNDWEGRGFRWATLVPPFKSGRGQRAVSLNAVLLGDVAAEFVVREGSHNLIAKQYAVGKEIDDTFVFKTENAGDIYILVRLIGESGEFICHSIGYTPFNEDVLRKLNLEYGARPCNMDKLEVKKDDANE